MEALEAAEVLAAAALEGDFRVSSTPVHPAIMVTEAPMVTTAGQGVQALGSQAVITSAVEVEAEAAVQITPNPAEAAALGAHRGVVTGVIGIAVTRSPEIPQTPLWPVEAEVRARVSFLGKREQAAEAAEVRVETRLVPVRVIPEPQAHHQHLTLYRLRPAHPIR